MLRRAPLILVGTVVGVAGVLSFRSTPASLNITVSTTSTPPPTTTPPAATTTTVHHTPSTTTTAPPPTTTSRPTVISHTRCHPVATTTSPTAPTTTTVHHTPSTTTTTPPVTTRYFMAQRGRSLARVQTATQTGRSELTQQELVLSTTADSR